MSVDGCQLKGKRFINVFLYNQDSQVFQLSLIRERSKATSKNMQ